MSENEVEVLEQWVCCDSCDTWVTVGPSGTDQTLDNEVLQRLLADGEANDEKYACPSCRGEVNPLETKSERKRTARKRSRNDVVPNGNVKGRGNERGLSRGRGKGKGQQKVERTSSSSSLLKKWCVQKTGSSSVVSASSSGRSRKTSGEDSLDLEELDREEQDRAQEIESVEGEKYLEVLREKHGEVDMSSDVRGLHLNEIHRQCEIIRAHIQDLQGTVRDATLFSSDQSVVFEEIHIPPNCIPIRCDVRDFDWKALGKEVQFDVIMMDPPWQLATRAPTRGVALGYSQLPNADIIDMDIPAVQTDGFIFIWVINKVYTFALEMMERWGYKMVDDISWVKVTVNRRLAKGHGFYLQHAKETCLVGMKGDPSKFQGSIRSDVIMSERRGQSQKPTEIYELIEELVPNGKYLEVFGRRNNLRDWWVTIGNEI